MTAYGTLRSVQEILLEGAKNFAPRLLLLFSVVFVGLLQFGMLYIKATQLVGEGLAAQAQHLGGARGVAALAGQGFRQKLSLDVRHEFLEVDGF